MMEIVISIEKLAYFNIQLKQFLDQFIEDFDILKFDI